MQKGKILSLFFVGLTGFTACVENKYDLSNVDTDDIAIGDEWVAPLGTGVIKVTDLIDLEKVEQIKVDKDGNYVAVYSDFLEADLTDLINSGDIPFPFTAKKKSGVDLLEGMVSVAESTVDLKETTDIFDAQDLILSFTDPHILMETSSNLNSTLKAQLDIKTGRPSSGGSAEVVRNANVSFAFESLSNKLWIGPVDPKNNVYIYRKAPLDGLIKIAPTYLNLELSVDPADLAIPSLDPSAEALFVKLNYAVEIPFSPAPDFKAEMNQILKDAFDDDFVDYIFTSGSVEIFGNVSNDLPLRFSMNLVITDANNEPVGITLEPQQVDACQTNGSSSKSKVSFLIAERDMAKMIHAKNIKIDFVAMGDEKIKGLSLNQKQEIKLELKLKKKGGIVINSSK